MKDFFENTNIKATIILGIITTIICVYFIQPIINIAGNYTGNIYTSLVNYYYRCAAIYNTSNRIATMILVIYLSIFLAILTGTLKNYKSAKEIINEIKALKKGHPKADLETKEEQEVHIEENLNLLEKKAIKIKFVNLFICLFYLIWIMFIAVFEFSPAIHKQLFDRAITKISPYIESSEITMLKSDWVRMKTKEDYNKISEKINIVINENNLD